MNAVLRKKNTRRQWLTVLAGLALGVILGTALSLRMTGQAQSYTKMVLECSCQVHTHNAACYNEEGALVCGKTDYVIHTHNADCFDTEGNLVCPLPERHVHVHSAECYDAEGNVICGQPDCLHVHTPACYDANGVCICPYIELQEHVHDGSCMKEVELTPDEIILIQIEESREASIAASIEAEEAEALAASQEAEMTEPEEEVPEGSVIDGPEEEPEEPDAPEEDPEEESAEDTAEEPEEDPEEGPDTEPEEDPEDPDAPEEDPEEEPGEDTEEESEEDTESEDAESAELSSESEDEAPEDPDELLRKFWSDETLMVKAEYKRSAHIPDGAELRVYTVTPENTPVYYDELLQEASEEDFVIGMGFFLNGREIKPEDDVVYTITLLDGNRNPTASAVTVLHVSGSGSLEIIEDTGLNADGSASFVAEPAEQTEGGR